MELLSNIVDSVNKIIWESFIKPRLIIVLLALFILWLYFFMAMKLGNLSKNIEKKITYQYDNIFYLWSVYYHEHLDTLKSNPWLIVFKAVLWSWKPKYIPNRKLIEETIWKIETKLWKKAIPDEERKKLSKLFRKYKIRKFISILLTSIIILIILFLVLLLVLILRK